MNNKDKEKLPLVVASAKSTQPVGEDDEIERTSHWQDEYDWQVNSALPPEDREGGIVRDLLNASLKLFGL